MDNLTKQFKKLKSIAPSAEFVVQCRQKMLEAPNRASANRFYYCRFKRRLTDSFIFALAVGLTAILVYLTYLSSGFIQNNQIKIARKVEPDFNISLEKAKYYKEVAPNVYIVVMQK